MVLCVSHGKASEQHAFRSDMSSSTKTISPTEAQRGWTMSHLATSMREAILCKDC